MKNKTLMALAMSMFLCAPISALANDTATQDGSGDLGHGGEVPENGKTGIPVYANLTGEVQTVKDEDGTDVPLQPGDLPGGGGSGSGENYEITFPTLLNLSHHAESTNDFTFLISVKGDLLGTTNLDFSNPASFDMTASGKTRTITTSISAISAGQKSVADNKNHWKLSGIELDRDAYDATSGKHKSDITYKLSKDADFSIGLWKGMFKVNVAKTTTP